jgi:hypothetical protein
MVQAALPQVAACSKQKSFVVKEQFVGNFICAVSMFLRAWRAEPRVVKSSKQN